MNMGCCWCKNVVCKVTRRVSECNEVTRRAGVRVHFHQPNSTRTSTHGGMLYRMTEMMSPFSKKCSIFEGALHLVGTNDESTHSVRR